MRAKILWIGFGIAVAAVALCGWTAIRWTRAPQYNWEQVESPDARFRISFPSKPTPSQEQDTAVDGTHFTSTRLTASPSKRVIYAISWWENPAQKDKSTDELFTQFRDCNIKVFHGMIVSEKETTLQGNRARDTEVWAPGGLIVFNRSIRAGSRLYSVMVIDSSSHRDTDNVYKFFDSMTIN